MPGQGGAAEAIPASIDVNTHTRFHWFALTVRPQHEKSTARALSNQGLEGFLPLYLTRRRWSDRIKELELPLFAGYVFCRFAPEHRLGVLTTPGVTSIVGFGGAPVPVNDQEIAALQQTVASGLPVQPWPFLECGQRVRIERGPLRGLEAILVRSKDFWRVVLNVDLLRRSVAVEIDRDVISPLAVAASRGLKRLVASSAPAG